MRAEYLEARPGVSQADRQQVRDFDLYLKARHALIKNRHEVTRGRETGRKGEREPMKTGWCGTYRLSARHALSCTPPPVLNMVS